MLGLFQAASYTRYVRSAVLDVVRLDYVTTARAKGLAERTVTLRHIARNALIPVVTLVALQMPAVFGGAIVTEQIFRVPGIGSLLINAILANDTPVIMAVTFVFACLVVALQPHRGPALWLARPSHLLPAERRSRRPLARPASVSPGRETWRRFRRHRLAMASAVVLGLLVLGVVVGPCSGRSRSTRSTSRRSSQRRRWRHPFGTDDLGQDLLARMIYGGRISLAVGLAAMVVATIVGVVIGAVAGMSRGLARSLPDVGDRPLPVAAAAAAAAADHLSLPRQAEGGVRRRGRRLHPDRRW